MITVDLLQFVAVAFAVCGLATVIWEIASRDPGIFRQMTEDARGFAERPATRSEMQDGRAPGGKTPDKETRDEEARDSKTRSVSAGGKPHTPQRAA